MNGQDARWSSIKARVTRFRFTNEELDRAFTDLATWHEFVRRREAEMLFSLLPKRRFGTALEIGAGDGGQSVTIAKYCDHLVCIEHAVDGNAIIGTFQSRDLPNVEYRLADAQDLSQFHDSSFDLIFSSNVLRACTGCPA
jgi:ubiquinone/menaquinone biosynthesis C-methylase UbiE